MTRDPLMVIWPDGQTDRYRDMAEVRAAMEEYRADGGRPEDAEVWRMWRMVLTDAEADALLALLGEKEK